MLSFRAVAFKIRLYPAAARSATLGTSKPVGSTPPRRDWHGGWGFSRRRAALQGAPPFPADPEVPDFCTRARRGVCVPQAVSPLLPAPPARLPLTGGSTRL